MADHTSQPRGLVFCHVCQNEWHENEHGLTCPACNSDFVELIEDGNDPRDSHTDDVEEIGAHPDPLPHHPLHAMHSLHHHHPWGTLAPDPDESDISHMEWSPSPGVHFTRTSAIRIGSPGRAGADHPFAPLLQNFSAMMRGPDDFERTFRPANVPRSPSQSPHHHGIDSPPLGPGNANIPQPNAPPVDSLQGLMRNVLRVMNEIHGGEHTGGPPMHIFAQFLNPANAQHGDAVYSEEALDRIISQFMEAQNGSGAPGPASAEAIAALPKTTIDSSMLGSDGKAECSVCMDNVSVGDEVTLLPCSHWFHGECVGAWLEEHDTCPHCRQGIMPKDSESGQSGDVPRQPGQAPRNSRPPLSPGHENGFQFVWHSGSSGNQPNSPGRPETHSPSSRHERSRRRSARSGGEGSSSGGGQGSGNVFDWVRSRFSSGNNHEQ